MERFLEVGPDAAGFETESTNNLTKIDGREVISSIVERPPSDDQEAAKAIIKLIEADNSFRYVLVATAPTGIFEDWKPTFDVMLASLVIKE